MKRKFRLVEIGIGDQPIVEWETVPNQLTYNLALVLNEPKTPTHEVQIWCVWKWMNFILWTRTFDPAPGVYDE